MFNLQWWPAAASGLGQMHIIGFIAFIVLVKLLGPGPVLKGFIRVFLASL